MGNKIGRITTSGEIIEYKIPTENAKPHAIASGIGGELWFTEWGSNQIGRITSCGKIVEYEILTPGSEPHGLVLGPDGAIWFAEESNQIGQLVY